MDVFLIFVGIKTRPADPIIIAPTMTGIKTVIFLTTQDHLISLEV